MDAFQQRRALVVISKIQCAIDRGVTHLDKEGRRLHTVGDVIDAWAHDGVTIKELGSAKSVLRWQKSA